MKYSIIIGVLTFAVMSVIWSLCFTNILGIAGIGIGIAFGAAFGLSGGLMGYAISKSKTDKK